MEARHQQVKEEQIFKESNKEGKTTISARPETDLKVTEWEFQGEIEEITQIINNPTTIKNKGSFKWKLNFCLNIRC